MGHCSGPAAVDQPGCRVVLPVIEEEPEPEGEGSPETTRMVAERRKAIVARMRELLSRAAAVQSAHSRLRRSTVATAKKWKRVVRRIHKRGADGATCDDHRQHVTAQEDSTLSSSSSISSKSSFNWDAAAADSCCSASALSPANWSPPLWPAPFVSTQAETTAHHQQRQVSSPANGVLRLSCTSSWSEDDDTRMAHWVTTDSDFVVLEL